MVAIRKKTKAKQPDTVDITPRWGELTRLPVEELKKSDLDTADLAVYLLNNMSQILDALRDQETDPRKDN